MRCFFLTFVETHCNNNYDHNICNAITDGHTLACIAGSVRLEISRRSSRRSETSTRAIHGAIRVPIVSTADYPLVKLRPRFVACTLDCPYEKLGKSCSSDERRKAYKLSRFTRILREKVAQETLYRDILLILFNVR